MTETGDRYALRVHRPSFRTPAEVRSELLFMTALADSLADGPITVPRPVGAADGSLLVEIAGRACDLLTWVDGRVLRPTRGLGLAGVRLLGEALARLHSFAEAWEPPPHGFRLLHWDHAALFTAASPYRPPPLDGLMSREDRRLFEDVAERTRAVFELLDADERSQGIIHADFILLNCHFVRRPRGWEVGVIDFDDLGRGYFLYDLCPLLGNLADFPRYSATRRAFLDGYRSIRELPSELEVHLPVLMAARHAAVCLWAAGIDRGEGAGVPVREHIAYRLDRMRACLALASR